MYYMASVKESNSAHDFVLPYYGMLVTLPYVSGISVIKCRLTFYFVIGIY